MGEILRRIRAALCRALCGRSTQDVCSNADGALTDKSFIFVAEPTSGSRVRSGFVVRGCSRTFESNVPWRLVDSDDNELAAGATSGGGVDEFAPFSFAVTFSVGSQQIGHLEVNEEDVSGAEGLPPVRNVVPLMLQP